MINTCVIFPFDLVMSLVFQPKSSSLDMVPNQVEVVVLRQHKTEDSPLNYEVSMVIGLLSKVKNIT